MTSKFLLHLMKTVCSKKRFSSISTQHLRILLSCLMLGLVLKMNWAWCPFSVPPLYRVSLRAQCWEPAWGTPPMAKVMRKEAQHTQRQGRASGVPLEILEHLPPKPESAYFTALCSHLHLWLYGGLSPTCFGKRVNLELQLIIIPGRDKSVSTYKLLWKSSSLPE